MRQLNGVYAQTFNRRHVRVGHLFQGRYQAILVQRDEHLLSAVRYIVRKPLRAGIGATLEKWRWSSHSATMGRRASGFLGTATPFATSTRGRSERGSATANSSSRTTRLLTLARARPRRSFLRRIPLSRVERSPDFPRAYLEPSPRRSSISSPTRRTWLRSRTFTTWYGYSMRQLASHLGCGLTTVHRRIRAYESQEASPHLRAAHDASRPSSRSPDLEHGRPDPV